MDIARNKILTTSSRRRIHSLVDVAQLFRMGIITPSSVPLTSILTWKREYLYLGSMLMSASDAPSYIFKMK
jgi:hypothetical protein